jgi:hypothetical protein
VRRCAAASMLRTAARWLAALVLVGVTGGFSSCGGGPWIDSVGNLWLFGEGVFDSNGNLLPVGNDLWRYTPSTGLWTWIAGSMTQGAPRVYGTEGTAAPGNVPGGRDIGVSWLDGAGNFWLFGGYVPGAALNDLWKYVPPAP